LPLLAWTGLTPHKEANDRLLTRRSGLSPGGQQQRRCDIGADALEGSQGRGDLLGDALEP